jgi:hypothetical protein
VPGPRRSEDAPVVSGEAVKSRSDERAVDAPGRIMVTPMPRARTVDPVVAEPAPRAAMPTAPERRGGVWLVVLVYVMSAAALGYAIWERFLRR